MENTHPADDVIESYAMNRLAEPELGCFEEHLLVCSRCRAEVAQTDEFLSATRLAAAALERETAHIPRQLHLPFPSAVWVGVTVAAICIWLYFGLLPREPERPQSVVLIAVRSGQDATVAAAGRATRLELDATGLPGGDYRMDVVGGTGSLVESKTVAIKANSAVASVRGLSRGTYWVRLSQSGQIVREFSLQVR